MGFVFLNKIVKNMKKSSKLVLKTKADGLA